MSGTTTSEPNRPEGLKCNICGRIFSSIDSLNEHKRIEHGESSEPPVGVG
ncbi:MAG TPA: C2H2-type zinc finger protein [Nitrososphaeraceae archaeon]